MRATVGCLGFALAFSAVTAGQNANVIVPTQSGPVRGVIEGDIRVFRGIPFAAPPVGDLRWYPPAPPIPWTGIRDASTFGNVCPEIDYNGNLVGNEDCLVLNIYTAANLDPRAEQPVMVFFHGGGDITGSSQVAPYGSPPPLATHGVIVVTAEYRVGALGFFVHPLLAIEGRGSTGNYGLMDHLAALAWCNAISGPSAATRSASWLSVNLREHRMWRFCSPRPPPAASSPVPASKAMPAL